MATTNGDIGIFRVSYHDLQNTQGKLHIYWLDKKHTLVNCNKQQLDTISKYYKIDKQDIIGRSVQKIFCKKSENLADVICHENEEIMSQNSPKQFLNIWLIPNHVKITLLTIKIPYYDSKGKIDGVFGISQYITQITLNNILKYQLTSKEVKCLSHLLKGRTSREIADQLNLSRRTVEHHLENIKNKLDCQSKSHLINKVIDLGILEEAFANNVNIKESTLVSKPIEIQNLSEIKMFSLYQDEPCL